MNLFRRDFLRTMAALPAALRAADPVSFSCDIMRTRTGLVVAYTVRNDSGGDIGLFNRIPTVENYRETGFRPENAYIDLEGSSLQLRKMALPLPPGINMTIRPIPYVTRVAAGQTYREELTYSEPVAVDDPMRRARIAAASPGKNVKASRRRESSMVVFSLGLFRVTADLRLSVVSAQYPDIQSVWPPGPPVDRQQVFTRNVQIDPRIGVLDYE